MSKEIEKYDKKGNLIYVKYNSGQEQWRKYNKNNRVIYFKNSYGHEWRYTYYENNTFIYSKNNRALINSKYYENWYRVDKNSNWKEIMEQEYKEMEYLSGIKFTKFTRFEIMDI